MVIKIDFCPSCRGANIVAFSATEKFCVLVTTLSIPGSVPAIHREPALKLNACPGEAGAEPGTLHPMLPPPFKAL